MVVFTCNHCGESLKKQAVEKHYQWKACRNGGIFISCMDCLKDFREQEYVAHTKCISEAEKYSGKDYVPKASANKGQRKQEAWIDIIQKVLERGDLSQSIRNTLNSLTNHENVPRKRPKFANFMKNISRSTSQQDVNRVFDLIEEAFKAGKEMEERLAAEAKSKAAAANAVEDTNEPENGKDNVKKRKSEDTVEEEEEPSKKKKKKKNAPVEEEKEEEVPVAENGDSGKGSKKKKKSAKVANGESSNGHENGSSNEPGFSWKDTIRTIVAGKGNSISLKKLQTKVLKAYQKETGESETVNDHTIDVVLRRKLKKMKNISVDDDRVVITA